MAHLPVIRALIDQLGIHAIVDAALPQHPLSRVSDADCVVTMMLNVLCGRVALFRMDEWMARTDVELLLGAGREADAFDDSRLATALDHLDTVGTDHLLTEVVKTYLQRPNRETVYSVHQDFTSYSLYGEYEDVSPWGPVPLHGHSKDLRPDLKQLVFGLSLHGTAGIPQVCSALDGNTSDARANRDHLSRLAKLLPDEDEVTIVGDCKLVDGQTLGQLLSAGFHFVSLLPDTYALRAELVATAWTAEADGTQWPLLGSHPGRLKADPPTLYRGKSVEAPFRVLLHRAPGVGEDGPPEAIPSVEALRFLVVYSDSLAALFDAQLDGRLADEEAGVVAALKRVSRQPESCEQDALRAARKALPALRFHHADLTAPAETRELKRTAWASAEGCGRADGNRLAGERRGSARPGRDRRGAPARGLLPARHRPPGHRDLGRRSNPRGVPPSGDRGGNYRLSVAEGPGGGIPDVPQDAHADASPRLGDGPGLDGAQLLAVPDEEGGAGRG